MIRIPLFSPHQQEHDEPTLLQNLLQTPIPTEHEVRRPVALRSAEERRRVALGPFRRQTWVDRALYRLEQVLLLVVAGFYILWFADGYGRDWLHQHRAAAHQQHRAAAEIPPAPTEPAPAIGDQLPIIRSRPPTADYLVPQPVAPAPPPDAEDQRPTRLIIPAIEVDSPVEEVFVRDGAWQVADYAVGYHHGSALPGEPGNTVMAGHAGLRGSVFRHLGEMQAGDDVFVEADGWRFHYHVREVRKVRPSQVEVTAPTAGPVLTLITCTDWDTMRLVVIADIVGSRPQ
ncbi:MAG: sortase [Chloroflexaceae bacterium]|nr:sortase [Chloroflexaceae bacterium]